MDRDPFPATVVELSPDDFALLSSAVAERRCREEVGFGTFAEAAALYRPDPPCPACKARGAWRDGLTDAGVQRFLCHECGTRFNSLTGTVLERGKSDMPTWVDFVRLMRFNVPIDAIAEVCRVSHQTAWEWRHRLFEAVDDYQDRLVLRDRVWLDDTPDGKVQTSVYRRDLGIRAHPARKGRMRQPGYEWLAGLREIVIDPVRCPLTYEEFVIKGYKRDRDGNWLDITPDGFDHPIDAVGYALIVDILRG